MRQAFRALRECPEMSGIAVLTAESALGTILRMAQAERSFIIKIGLSEIMLASNQ